MSRKNNWLLSLLIGLTVPAGSAIPTAHKMAIEKVTVNPKLDDNLFTEPAA
jgi:hypothetical protein